MKLTADTSNLRARTLAMLRNSKTSRRDALRAMADAAGSAYDRISPRDTNRYVRAWLEAAGEAGSSPLMLPTLRPSRRAGYIKERILGQWLEVHRAVIRKDKWLKSMYPPGTKVGPMGRREQVKLEKLRKREARLKQEVDTLASGSEGALLLIGARGKNGFATLRAKVYGGRGFVHAASGTMYMWNREPHAQIIEAKLRTKAIVARYLKAVGAKMVSSKYLAIWAKGMNGLGIRRVA